MCARRTCLCMFCSIKHGAGACPDHPGAVTAATAGVTHVWNNCRYFDPVAYCCRRGGAGHWNCNNNCRGGRLQTTSHLGWTHRFMPMVNRRQRGGVIVLLVEIIIVSPASRPPRGEDGIVFLASAKFQRANNCSILKSCPERSRSSRSGCATKHDVVADHCACRRIDNPGYVVSAAVYRSALNSSSKAELLQRTQVQAQKHALVTAEEMRIVDGRTSENLSRAP